MRSKLNLIPYCNQKDVAEAGGPYNRKSRILRNGRGKNSKTVTKEETNELAEHKGNRGV